MCPVRAFIVEDNPVILKDLVTTLEELTPVRVVGTASTESDAVRELEQRKDDLDLVIVDIFLASGSGLGVLARAQALNLPVRRVVLTNYPSPDMRQRCADLGADRLFDKSRELDELITYCEAMPCA
jgi:DNA-binding NarL/FixJ family response regulator